MGKGGGSSTEQVSTLTRGQRGALNSLGSFVTPQIGQAADVFGGQRVAGASPLQQGAFDIFGGLAPGIGGALGGGLGGLQQSRESLQGFLGDFDPAASQQAFQSGVVDPSLRNFQQNVIPGITERFSNVAGSSGVLAKALADAGGDLQSNLGAQGALFNQNARNTFNQNRLNASGQLAGQSTQGLNFLNSLSGLGGQQRDIAQQGLGADFARFQEGQAVNNPILGLLPQLLGTQAFENVVTPQGPGLGGTLGTLAGAFLGGPAGAAVGSSLGSALLGGGAGAAGSSGSPLQNVIAPGISQFQR